MSYTPGTLNDVALNALVSSVWGQFPDAPLDSLPNDVESLKEILREVERQSPERPKEGSWLEKGYILDAYQTSQVMTIWFRSHGLDNFKLGVVQGDSTTPEKEIDAVRIISWDYDSTPDDKVV